MDAPQIEFRERKDRIQNFIQSFFVHSKRCGTAAHAHGTTFGFACWIDANGNLRASSQAAANSSNALRFGERLHVNLADALREDQFEFSFGFSRAAKKYSDSPTTCLRGFPKFAHRRNFVPTAPPQEIF